MAKVGKKNRELRILRVRQRIAEMYCEGIPQHEIASKVGLSNSAISKHIAKIREFWASLMLASYDEKINAEVAKYTNLERISMDSWHKSCEVAKIRRNRVEKALRVITPATRDHPATTELIPIRMVDERESKASCGDPRFLEMAKSCIDARVKLLGLLREEAVTNNNVFLNFDSLFSSPIPAASPQSGKIRAYTADPIEEAIAHINDSPPAESSTGS